jgi:pimeloyl-ACP methyl ester carboxylesterase
MTDTAASTIALWEQAEIARANATGLTPVVFVHGLWLISSSWQRWRDLFEANGYTTVAPGWPDDPATVEEARAHPEVFAHKMVQGITDHYLDAITQLDKKPAVIGHSFGGLIAQKIAGAGASAATVTIDNAPFRGVLPLPISSLRSALPVLGNPANYGKSIALTFEQYKYGWANNLDDTEAKELYETFHVQTAGAPLFQGPSRISTPSARPGLTPGTPTAVRCSLSPATATTRYRRRSPRPLSRSSPSTTRVSLRLSTSPVGATRWSSITDGKRSPT